MDMADRVFIASILTLALLVLLLERRSRNVAPQLIVPTNWRIDRINVPNSRPGTQVVDDVAYVDVSDAAEAGGE